MSSVAVVGVCSVADDYDRRDAGEEEEETWFPHAVILVQEERQIAGLAVSWRVRVAAW